MSWFEKIIPSRIKTQSRSKSVPEGLWIQCPNCNAQLFRSELDKNFKVCPQCRHHMRIGARERLTLFFDEGSTTEVAPDLEPDDPLKFRDSKRYRDRLFQAQKATGERDALVAMRGNLFGRALVASAFEFKFMGGSMGSVVGERFARAARLARDERIPLVSFAASGGARMQEALYSLFQMAKTSAALAELAEAGVPYVSVLTDPTTGGVSASLAMLGDFNLAEPGALIGFAGPRVIEQTVRETLPDGFQRSEFLLEHGAIDAIVDRRDLKDYLSSLLGMVFPEVPAAPAEASTS